jgi:hypothetical protein
MTAPKKAAAAGSASAPIARGQARTVIYCHGISNMPPEGVLRSEWDRALFGADQGERTRMAYWVDRERYPETAGFSTRAIGDDRATLQPEAEVLLEITGPAGKPRKVDITKGIPEGQILLWEDEIIDSYGQDSEE